MPKIALIGAGSIVFSTTLLNDMLATPSLSESEFMLMDPNQAKLQRVENHVRRLIDRHGLKATVALTTDRRGPKGADYVITTFQVGGMNAFRIDYEILKVRVDVRWPVRRAGRGRPPRSFP
jgi:alpha-galactosidase